MSDLNMQLVREYFELHLFHVLSYWQHEELPARLSEPAALLFVEHINPEPARDIEFLLRPGDVAQLERAMVEIRAWHADRFYPSMIESNPVLGHVVGDEARALAGSIFGGNGYVTILVIGELPQAARQRERSLHLLQELGVDHVIEFPTVLQEMLARISAYGLYAPSQTLQTLRLLKRYNLVRWQQLEFAFPIEAPPPTNPPPVDAAVVSDEGEEAE
ncbi:MAG: hypothetical protein HYV26_10900 [Candidatus Hydrogenedentes bacterium]|nr:hypothetical protein [Candidatus Hydrogenedentota bacterium]MBI3119836.1 hypothetical protein [Candidatus Hydrogenedentota bacterium]